MYIVRTRPIESKSMLTEAYSIGSPSGKDFSPINECQSTPHMYTLPEKKLTSIDLLGRLLRLLTSIILSGLLRGETSFWTRIVQIACIVHCFLQRVGFPAEDVVAVGGGAAAVKRVVLVRYGSRWT